MNLSEIGHAFIGLIIISGIFLALLRPQEGGKKRGFFRIIMGGRNRRR